jgi:hypothetical protein
MRKPKIRVRTTQAVDLIRSGASDSVLMETFGLSRVGLRKLFKKLVDAEEIQQSELDRRAVPSHQSQTVDVSAILDEVLYELDGSGDKSARELNPRKSRVGFKQRARPSETGVENRPKKLLSAAEAAGFPTTERDTASKLAEKPVPRLGTRNFSLPEDDPWHRNNRRWTFSGFVQKHTVTIAAFVGGIAGMAVLSVGFLIFIGLERPHNLQPKLPANTPVTSDDAHSDADKQVQEAMSILAAIARDRNDPAKSGKIAWGASELEDCLNNCKKSYAGGDGSEELELSNCRKECLHTHSELFKKIRKKYHGQTE